MEKRNVVIYVAGQRFSLSTADTDEYVIGIGERVDMMIKGIQKDNPRFNRDACATLAALDLCDDETKLRQMLDLLREQVKDYLKDSEELRTENDRLKAQVKELEEKLESAKSADTGTQAAAAPCAEPAPMAKPAEQTPAPSEQKSTRQTAFVGKDFRSDKKKKKKHEHNHQNPYQAKYSQPKAADTTPEEKPQNVTDLPEDIEFPDEPYQINLFEDMI